MKKNKKFKIVIVLLLLLLTTGCTKTLTDSDKKAVKNETTGQTLTENILCRPTNKETIKLYEKNKVKIDKLPECKDFSITSGKYEGLWTSLFVKPLAFILIWLGNLVKNNAISIIIVSIAIRLIAFPLTKKTAMQSELIKKAQPELNRIQKKYANKQDQESMIKQNQEIMMVYQKYKINPISGCLFAFIQLPIFIAFFEAIQRTPVIFEDKFLGLQLGTTPWFALSKGNFWYLIIPVIVFIVTFFSLKLNGTQATDNSNPAAGSTKMMMNMMVVVITISSFQLSTAIGLYWITSSLFTVIQNLLVARSGNSAKIKKS